MIHELLEHGLVGGIAGVASYVVLRAWRRPKKKATVVVDGSIAWAWTRIGFRCPKCLTAYDPPAEKHQKLCECHERHIAHFHFECIDCGFKAIMRTADDK